MKPPKFEYHAPKSLEEALEALGRYDGDAKVLAGGQSLMPLLNFRLAPLGIKINELPMTPSKLWALIRKARES